MTASTKPRKTPTPGSHDGDKGDKDEKDVVAEIDRTRDEATDQRRREYDAYLRRLAKSGSRGQDGNEGGRLPPISPFLVIRNALPDLGARPTPPGFNFWSSPDIWVDSSDPFGNPVAGEPNVINARVLNLGSFQAVPVQVDFFWADPSLGLVPASMHHLGTEWVDIPSMTSAVVSCPTPWVPVVVNGGHECVIVQCSNWILDPITQPFNPVADRHVAQRNLHVLAATPGTKAVFDLRLNNAFPFSVTAAVDVSIRHLRLREKLEPAGVAAAAVSFLQQNECRPDALIERYPKGSLGHRIGRAASRRAERHPELVATDDFEVAGRFGSIEINATITEKAGRLQPSEGASFAADFSRHAAQNTLHRSAAKAMELLTTDLRPSSYATAAVVLVVPERLADDEILVVELAQRVGEIVLGGYTVVIAPST